MATSPPCKRGSLALRLLLVGLVVTALLGLASTRGNSQAVVGELPDSLQALVDSLLGVGPDAVGQSTFSAETRGDVSSVRMKSMFNSSLLFKNGISLNAGLSAEDRHYRLQDRFGRAREMTGSFRKMVFDRVETSLWYRNSRTLDRVVAAVGGIQDVSLNNEIVGYTMTYKPPSLGRLSFNSYTNGNYTDSRKTFKDDQILAAAIGAGVSVPIIKGLAVARFRGATSTNREETVTNLGTHFDPFISGADSLTAALAIDVSDSLDVYLDFTDYSSDRRFADQQRSSTGAQQIGAENLAEEHEAKTAQTINVRMNTRPFLGMGMTLALSHAELSNSFDLAQARNSSSAADAVDANFNYVAPFGTQATLAMQHSKKDLEFGPLSINARNEVYKSVNLSLTQPTGTRTSIQVTAQSNIAQTFYKSDDNPRDRDQVNTRLSARITSNPFSKIKVSIAGAYAQTDVVSIDVKYSNDNNVVQRYDLSPTIAYEITPRITLTQVYGLKIDFTDYDYRPTDNFLDRTITLTNDFTWWIIPKVRAKYSYRLALHDRGSYLPPENDPTGEKRLVVEGDDRRDQSIINVDYQLFRGVRVEVQHDYSHRVDHVTGSVSSTSFKEGSIEGGASGSYSWGTGRTLQFVLKRTSRYGRQTSEAQNNYWVFNSTFKYAF